MNQKLFCSSTAFVTAVLASALVISDEMPLAAGTPQTSQPAAASQSSDSLPDAPQPQITEVPQQPTQAPSGAAGAKAAVVKGAPAAQPMGAAVAPARQHSHRSLLIKTGLILGAGVAVGSVVALSERSPNRPPGAAPSTRP